MTTNSLSYDCDRHIYAMMTGCTNYSANLANDSMYTHTDKQVNLKFTSKYV